MFKDLVVPITGTPGDASALAAAIVLASHFDAHLAVLEMLDLPIPAAAPWGMMPDMEITEIHGKLRAFAVENVEKLKARMQKETIQSEVRLMESLFMESPRIAAMCARYADLTVMAGAEGDATAQSAVREYFSSLLLESGRPVLVVPPHWQATWPTRRVAIAWQPTREAARALHDAMPLLEKAEAVDIVVVDPDTTERGHGDQPGADLATHLARHGLKVDVVVRASESQSVAAVLLEYVRQSQADLLVAGGFGHSRMREWALGGVTRELLVSASIPVLYSH